MLTSIPCTLMRGGTSKGLYFDAHDLPTERETRDRVLLAAMGSPDVRQIDGVGGAHPLTSKVAVIEPHRNVTTPISTTSSSKSSSTKLRSATVKTAATFSRASDRGRSRMAS